MKNKQIFPSTHFYFTSYFLIYASSFCLGQIISMKFLNQISIPQLVSSDDHDEESMTETNNLVANLAIRFMMEGLITIVIISIFTLLFSYKFNCVNYGDFAWPSINLIFILISIKELYKNSIFDNFLSHDNINLIGINLLFLMIIIYFFRYLFS